MFKVEEIKKVNQFRYGRRMALKLRNGQSFTKTRRKGQRERARMNSLVSKSMNHSMSFLICLSIDVFL